MGASIHLPEYRQTLSDLSVNNPRWLSVFCTQKMYRSPRRNQNHPRWLSGVEASGVRISNAANSDANNANNANNANLNLLAAIIKN